MIFVHSFNHIIKKVKIEVGFKTINYIVQLHFLDF